MGWIASTPSTLWRTTRCRLLFSSAFWGNTLSLSIISIVCLLHPMGFSRCYSRTSLQTTDNRGHSHNTFASGGSDGLISIWDHNAKKRMKLYPKYPTAISALAFSPDGKRLAIGASYEHDNAVTAAEEKGRVMVLVKETVMEDCRVSLASCHSSAVEETDFFFPKSQKQRLRKEM